jgi:uncharacterized RDD family membrane protein YckC
MTTDKAYASEDGMLQRVTVSSSIGSETLAAPADRFAAQVLDTAITFLLFWRAAFLCARRYSPVSIQIGPFTLPLDLVQLTAAFFALAVGIYFLLMEWAVGATVGKLLCRIRVAREDGTRSGLIASFLRNALRPADVAGFWLLALFGGRRQRVGDRIAGTVVVHTVQPHGELLPGNLAGWERRGQATFIDAAFIAVLACAYLLATGCAHIRNGVRVDLALYHLTVLVLLVFFYWVIPEAVYGATPGKALAGLCIRKKDGGRCDFTAATLRTLARPFDLLPLGLPAFLLVRFMPRRQRLGDLLAGTVVTLKP